MVCAYVENPGQLCGVPSLILPLCGLQGQIQVFMLPKQAPSPSETSHQTCIFQFYI